MGPTGILLIVGLVVVGLVAIGLLAVSISRQNEGDPLQDALADYITEENSQANLEEIEMSVPFTQRVIIPIAEQIAEFTQSLTPEETIQKTQRQIELAGSPSGITPGVIWVLRFVAMFAMAGVLFLVLLLTGQRTLFVIIGLLGGGLFGFMMPPMYLKSKIDRRQEDIIKQLPDALDLMSICVQAGLGFDQAMQRVSEKWDGEIALAFGRVVREIALGKTRREALRSMSESIDVPDVTTFTGAIIQADQLGVSIAKVLKIQADQLRIKRRQRAQEKAQQAPIKMIFPMVIFIFPTIYIVLLGPAGVRLAKQFLGW
jgi:tight adherence protein C